MDAFDKLAQDIANASGPFALGNDWEDMQAGFAALADWRKQTNARLNAIEARIGKGPVVVNPGAGV